MRIARDMGDVSAIFPDGITHLADLPYTLFDALRLALGWLHFEELPEDERPERAIWMDGKAMREHWKLVKKARDRKYSGKPSEEIEGPIERNAAVDELLV